MSEREPYLMSDSGAHSLTGARGWPRLWVVAASKLADQSAIIPISNSSCVDSSESSSSTHLHLKIVLKFIAIR